MQPRRADPVRAAIAALREAMANEAIRRLEISWTLGIAADLALTVVLLVVVFQEAGAVATGLLGAVRMIPAVVSAMLSGAILRRFDGRRLLLAIGLTRTLAAIACSVVIAFHGPILLLFAIAAVAAAAGAPVRPTQATLMPAIARSPGELVAANTAWGMGEGAGALFGPFLAGLLIAAGDPAVAAAAAAVGFIGTAIVAVGLRFEHAEDASGGGDEVGGGLRLREGLAALGRRSVPRWTMLGVYGQVLTRNVLNTLIVVAAIELLDMGEAGVGILNGALGLGGLLGAIFAMTLTRTDQLVRTQAAALAYWGAPIALIGLLPFPIVALTAMIVIGVANAVYDVAIFTIFQRGSSNQERAAIFSVFEGVAGLGAVSGSLLGPVLLEAFGIRGALAVTGAILPVVALFIYGRVGRADRVAVVDEPLAQLLRQVAVFAQLPLTAIERLANGLVEVQYEPGQTLMRQGEPGDRFIVVDSGEVDVSIDGQSVQRLGHAAGVGEIALLRRSPRTATVTALTQVSGVCVDAGTFLAAVSGPAAAAVTERIAESNLRRGLGEPNDVVGAT
jgi:MFS family permease